MCDQCGKEFIRRRSQVIRNPHHFCGKECRARWRGLHHGFHVHPENCMTSVRKYDYDAIWQKHLETGYNARQLSGFPGYSRPFDLRDSGQDAQETSRPTPPIVKNKVKRCKYADKVGLRGLCDAVFEYKKRELNLAESTVAGYCRQRRQYHHTGERCVRAWLGILHYHDWLCEHGITNDHRKYSHRSDSLYGRAI